LIFWEDTFIRHTFVSFFVLFIVVFVVLLLLLAKGVDSSLLILKSLLLSGIAEDNCIHHVELTVSTSVSDHSVDWDVFSGCVDPKWSKSMTINIEVLVILSVPSFVVDVEKILAILCLDHQLYLSCAPNVLGVAGVHAVSHFN